MNATSEKREFWEFEGDLYRTDDNGEPDCIRKEYALSLPYIENGRQLRACLRAGAFTSLGGYPLFFLCSDGEALSFASVRENLEEITDAIRCNSNCGWRVVGVAINWEDANLYCAHSGEKIPSAYAED